MDLHFGDSEPTDEERAAVDALLGPPESSWEGAGRSDADLRWARGGRAARDRRDLLLPGLHAINDRIGWISEGALDYLCRRLTVPPAEAYGVATFYALFSVEPRPATVLHVCTDLACAAAGADDLCAGGAERLGSGVGVQRSPCLGLCARAPAALAIRAGDPVRTAVAAPATVDGALRAADAPGSAPEEPPAAVAVPQAGQEDLVLLRRVGVVDPASLDDYRAHGGYTALRRAFALGPAGVIREVGDSGLVGRGGAAFPASRKWQATASRPDHPHHLVCNADESEPGTFKDRVIMEGDPHALVEAMTVAAYAIGAHRGFLYIRGEYPRAVQRMQHAVDQARVRGLQGDDILSQGYAFDIEIRRGAGAYICGEETALFNSIEGYRGEPRSKPPFPVEKGLFGRPTVENNVETLVNVLPILTMGAPAYDESRQTQTATVCAYCGVGCTLTLHVQDNEIVKVTSPHDNPVTHGNLCIKGRFGYQHVQNRG
ncbi:NAD(P)H-dependent oxidoreductase subunit E [Streptomyces sp. IMTB 2501]|uniref:NAD(P)H-dependent oxidoreductase subunit E n=1 Tax=Streptomyces sp. IMTB 2501 TaxID=1776340 RepID=UPI0009A21C8C